MPSVERTRETFGHNLSDEAVEEIRAGFRVIAEIIFEELQRERAEQAKQKN